MSLAVLDDPAALRAHDPQDMLGTATRLPEHARAGLEAGATFEPPAGNTPARALVIGMGGSAVGGTIAAAALADDLTAPLEVVRGYHLPGGVDERAFVCAVSYSGSTEETLSAYREALSRGARTAVICTGGELARRAQAAKAPVINIPGGLAPRAALGYLLFALLEVLRRAGVVTTAPAVFEGAVAQLERAVAEVGPGRPVAENPAKRIAGDLLGRWPIIYGGSPALAAAAYRWRTQLNENTKVLASHHELPELNHNEVVGWDLPESLGKQTAVILLRSAHEDTRTAVRARFTADLIRTRTGALHELICQGDHPLHEALHAVAVGDFVSLYLAALRKLDPYPVPTLDALKRTLSR